MQYFATVVTISARQSIHSQLPQSHISYNEMMSPCDLSITYNMREIYGLIFSSQLSLVTEPFNAHSILPFYTATKHRLTT
jgi:hypothetical protein